MNKVFISKMIADALKNHFTLDALQALLKKINAGELMGVFQDAVERAIVSKENEEND